MGDFLFRINIIKSAMPTYTSNNILQITNQSPFETEIQKLLRSLSNGSQVNSKPFTSQDQPSNADVKYSNILFDYGNGRISRGLRSLELLSKLCDGVDQSKLFLFNSTIFYGSPIIIKRATDDQLYNIVIVNLGMDGIVASLADAETETFKSLCIATGKEVRAGTYYKNNAGAILRECKSLTRKVIRMEKQA